MKSSSNGKIRQKLRALSQTPENIGSSASLCARPTVKGLRTPEAKPQPTARRLIATPVSASHPRLTDSATTIGTIGTTSSKEPTKAPRDMNRSVTTVMRV